MANRSDIGLNQDVFLVTADGIGRILDFNRGQFYGLDPVATTMLGLMLKTGRDDATRRMAEDYEAPLERIEADLDALLADLTRRRLIVSARGRLGLPEPARVRWLLLRAGLICASSALPARSHVGGAAAGSRGTAAKPYPVRQRPSIRPSATQPRGRSCSRRPARNGLWSAITCSVASSEWRRRSSSASSSTRSRPTPGSKPATSS